MAMTNAEKQAAYRERMKAAGYKFMQVWIRDDPIQDLKNTISELESRKKYQEEGLKVISADAALDMIQWRLMDIYENLTSGEVNSGRAAEKRS